MPTCGLAAKRRSEVEENKMSLSKEARALYDSADVIDLHLDSFIWTRLFGYRLREKNGYGLFGNRFFGQTDLVRILEAGVTGATWIITTNPARPARNRRNTFFDNLAHLEGIFRSEHERFRLVQSAADYEKARRARCHGAFIGIQGGNALDFELEDLRKLKGRILRITLIHLTNSRLGTTSAPYGRFAYPRLNASGGLTELGRNYIEICNEEKIFVDLAHVAPKTFFDAASVHDKNTPMLVTHTGVSGVYPHWRNLSDEQIRVIAESGGVVGVMLQADFLGRSGVTVETVVDHLEHIIQVGGERCPAIGTDYDGAIVPPKDLPDPTSMPHLVDAMLRRSWDETRIRRILGLNALEVIRALRG